MAFAGLQYPNCKALGDFHVIKVESPGLLSQCPYLIVIGYENREGPVLVKVRGGEQTNHVFQVSSAGRDGSLGARRGVAGVDLGRGGADRRETPAADARL